MATPLVTGPLPRADLAYLQGRIERARGMLTRSYDLLIGPAVEVAGPDPERAARMLAVAGLAAFDAHDVARLTEAARRAARLVEVGRPMPFAITWLLGAAAVLRAEVTVAVPLIAETIELARRADRPFELTLAGGGALFLGDDEASVGLFARGIATARRAATPAGLAATLAPAAMLDMWTSRFAAAAANAAEAIRLAEDTGQPNFAALAVRCWPGCTRCRGGRSGPLSWPSWPWPIRWSTSSRRVRPSRRGRWGWPSSLPVARRPR